MTWCGWKINENCHVLVNEFNGNFRSKTLGCRTIKSVFRDVKRCFNASWGLKGLRPALSDIARIERVTNVKLHLYHDYLITAPVFSSLVLFFLNYFPCFKKTQAEQDLPSTVSRPDHLATDRTRSPYACVTLSHSLRCWPNLPAALAAWRPPFAVGSGQITSCAATYLTMLLRPSRYTYPVSKRSTSLPCCLNAGPASQTLAQHWANIESTYLACWAVSLWNRNMRPQDVGLERDSHRLQRQFIPQSLSLIVLSVF